MESSDDRSYLQVHLWRSTSRKMTYPLFLLATFYMSGAVCVWVYRCFGVIFSVQFVSLLGCHGLYGLQWAQLGCTELIWGLSRAWNQKWDKMSVGGMRLLGQMSPERKLVGTYFQKLLNYSTSPKINILSSFFHFWCFVGREFSQKRKKWRVSRVCTRDTIQLKVS